MKTSGSASAGLAGITTAGFAGIAMLAAILSAAGADAATIVGHVRLTGPIPKPPTITMTADPVCDRLSPHGRPAEMIVAGPDGALANVFVYVRSGLPKKFVIPPSTAGEAKLDQVGCAFVPHAIALRVGQELTIHSSDPTMHNVAGRSIENAPFNDATPGEGAVLRRTFDRPELPVKLKCDIHPWMSAYVGVFDHPYFAVTGRDGSFTIDGLPESEYTVEAWHETLGSHAVKVEIDDEKKIATVDFSFAGN
ncbi:MAG TPA: hypothetical protein VN634_05995 [Candidatus Limnocylindrales bacterium]|nr:hypothetical protein [Candidatus Limnocylindrales bacterium]